MSTEGLKLGPFVGPFKVTKTGDSFRVEDTGTDSRVATCYDPANAKIVAEALNCYAEAVASGMYEQPD